MSKPIPRHQPATDVESDKPTLSAAFYQGTRSGSAQLAQSAQRAMRKVPEIMVYFWIIKLLTTAMGETTSGYLVHQFDPIIAVACGGIFLAIALVIQFSVRRYVAWMYWLAVVMVAVFGTMAADVFHVVRHLRDVVHEREDSVYA